MEDIDNILERDMLVSLEPSLVSEILCQPPFVSVEGLINPRDLNDGSLHGLKQGFAYRSGSLEATTTKGKEDLKRLGIRTIIDLRSPEEVAAFADPEIEDIAVVPATTSTWNRAENDVGAGKVGGNEVGASI